MEAIIRLGESDAKRASLFYDYLSHAIGPTKFQKLLERVMNKGFRFSESAAYNPWIRKGIAQGRAEGLAEGRTEEAASILLRLLSKRFGPLAEATAARIQSANVEQLERGADAILEATKLDDVLDAAFACSTISTRR